MLQFLTFSEKEILSPKYTQFSQPHLLISITNPGTDFEFTKTHHCKQMLSLSFFDEEDFTSDKVCFDKDMATKILTFINDYVEAVNTVIVHCGAGISRSVAVASALSKIINHKDDFVFSTGIPNMLVYLTILDTYFSNPKSNEIWSKIGYLRLESLKQLLDPRICRIAEYRLSRRGK